MAGDMSAMRILDAVHGEKHRPAAGCRLGAGPPGRRQVVVRADDELCAYAKGEVPRWLPPRVGFESAESALVKAGWGGRSVVVLARCRPS